MILHDHSEVKYTPVSTFIGGAYSVTYKGRLAGHVMHSASGVGWRYLLIGNDSNRDWISGFGTREYAADHLLSAYSPSAPWLT